MNPENPTAPESPTLEPEAVVEAEPIAAELRAIEHWQAARGVPAWQHKGAARLHGWGAGRELTEAAYADGVEAFANHTVKGA